MSLNLGKLSTETRNEKTMNLDTLTTLEVLTIMNEEDRKVPEAIEKALPNIEKAVNIIVDAIKNGGRLLYIGAGTSGRLGILDASECPPTFSTTTEIQGIMAGGDKAIRNAVEGAEDSKELAVEDLKNFELTAKDVVCGIAASGRTPYVIGGIEYAKSLGAKTVGVCCNVNTEIGAIVDAPIEVNCGPEVLTGSTRLKSGTAQKLILNMLSTASMVGLNKVYKNLMVDVKASNLKLIERCKRIVMMATGCEYQTAEKALDQCEYKPKTAIVMIERNCSAADAKKALAENEDSVRKAIAA